MSTTPTCIICGFVTNDGLRYCESHAREAREKTAEYESWYRGLNRAVVRQIALSLEDLPDMLYRDWFDSGMSIETAVETVLTEIEYEMPTPNRIL